MDPREAGVLLLTYMNEDRRHRCRKRRRYRGKMWLRGASCGPAAECAEKLHRFVEAG